MITAPYFHIQKLLLPEAAIAEYSRHQVDGSAIRSHNTVRWFEDLNQLNVFIGPNNSGKSRLLRHLFQSIVAGADFLPPIDVTRHSLDALRSAYTHLKSLPGLLHHPGFQDQRTQISSGLAGIESQLPLVDHPKPSLVIPALKAARQALADCIAAADSSIGNASYHPNLRDALRTVTSLASATLETVQPPQPLFPARYDFKLFYFPTLRTLRRYKQSNETPLHDLCRTQHFPALSPHSKWPDSEDSKYSRQIVTGETLYQDIRALLLGKLRGRTLVRDFEAFLAKSFFDGKPVALIPYESIDNQQPELHIKIGDEQEYPVQHLGDGIQQLIILTFHLFRHQDADRVLFIEEPELYLHPGYQRLLIDLLLNPPGNGSCQTFVATHSHQFLDQTIDQDGISVFSFRKHLPEAPGSERNAQFEVQVVSDDRRPMLGELGVRNSSVLLSNCTVWVEGITDRLYFRHFLSLFYSSQLGKDARRFQEDYHYSFVEYSGSNITHWSFLNDGEPRPERLCGELLLIADHDGQRWKEKRREALASALKERFIDLPCREIENILSPSVLEHVVSSWENRSDAIAGLCEAAYRDKPLGKFIDDAIVATGSTTHRTYSDVSGTIRDKLEFCKRAIACMHNWDDLTEQAKQVTQQVYSHLKKHNT